MQCKRIFQISAFLMILSIVLGAVPIRPVLAQSITLTPTSGPVGSLLSVTGTGFSANTTFRDHFAFGTSFVMIRSGTVSPTGAISDSFNIPVVPGGSYTVQVESSSGNFTSTFMVAPTIGLGTTSVQVGNSVSVSGNGFSASRTITISLDSASVTTTTSDASGSFATTFIVRESSWGSHTVAASDGIYSTSGMLSVRQLMRISPTSGITGSTLAVSGTGFNANQPITITWAGTSVVTSPATVITSNIGSFSATFSVPASNSRTVEIIASDGSNSATATFALSAGISLSTNGGNVGTRLTVSGTAFSSSGLVTVNFDGTQVMQATADTLGSFSASFNVPSSSGGAHIISASDGTSTSNAAFTVMASIRVSPSTGKVGTQITVTGNGFGANEMGIVVTYDSKPVGSGISANSQGYWSNTFAVPTSASGSHTIDAYGYTTTATTVSDITFTIGQNISISPTIGHVGETVDITGSGFSPNSLLRFAYDDREMPMGVGVTTDASGSFSKSIIIPKSQRGTHTITVRDGQNNNSQIVFNMESDLPAVPRLVSPADGARLGILGGIKPALKWASVTDPSEVTYALQLDTSPDFSQPILEREDILGNHYTLTAAEALPRGEYYWRVKAVDGASNESPWSQPQLLKSGLIPLWTLVTFILLAVLAAGGIVYFLLVRQRARKQEAITVPGVEIPQIIPGQWRLTEPEETTPRRAMPWRLALPQPAKGTKILSVENQARLKVIIDFAQSLPLIEPAYNADWLVDLVETSVGIEVSAPVYEQLLKGELQVRYEAAWMHHPTYQDMAALLEGQPLLQDLNTFVDAVNGCASEAILLLREIYRDAASEIPSDFFERGGWTFISAVYSDTLSWFLGKSLRAPLERDYSIKPSGILDKETETLWLCGEDTTSFAGPLMEAPNEEEALRLRALHLKLRRTYRNSNGPRQVMGMMTQLEVQRDRLLNVLGQFGHPLREG